MKLIHAPHEDRAAIEAALVGRRVVATQKARLRSDEWSPELDGGIVTLDDGTRLEFIGHDGGCACSAGCYDLVHLGEVDNIITAVHFEDDPDDDNDYSREFGSYSIFVVAGNQRINLATFEGTDGNGYYGTGYYVRIVGASDDD